MTIPRYWRELDHRYRLVGTKCPKCSKLYFPPRDVCPTCHRESIGKMKKVELNGKGSVYSYTIVYQDVLGFKEQKPYIIAIIEMDDGPKITAQIVDVEPEDLQIGYRVKAVFRRIREDGDSGVIQYGYKFTSL